jgi:hypothetical protein
MENKYSSGRGRPNLGKDAPKMDTLEASQTALPGGDVMVGNIRQEATPILRSPGGNRASQRSLEERKLPLKMNI